MPEHEKIDYLELPAKDIAASKKFFQQAFNWEFEDYGPDYCAFSNAGINGGFYKADLTAETASGSALIVFYSDNLEQTQSKITDAGGIITRPIFSFPGGRRFHFKEPGGNEFAVWGEPEEA